MPLFVLAMSAELFGRRAACRCATSIWVQLALATPVVLWGGWPFFERGWASLATRNLNMFTLIGIGVGAAYALQRRRDARAADLSRDRSARTGGVVPVYFEAAAVIITLVLLGQVLELRARAATGERDPRAARPRAEDGAAGQRDGREEDVPLERGAASAIGCACGPARRCRSTAS